MTFPSPGGGGRTYIHPFKEEKKAGDIYYLVKAEEQHVGSVGSEPLYLDPSRSRRIRDGIERPLFPPRD